MLHYIFSTFLKTKELQSMIQVQSVILRSETCIHSLMTSLGFQRKALEVVKHFSMLNYSHPIYVSNFDKH